MVRWEDPSGARLVLGLTESDVEDLLPSFAGAPGVSLEGIRRVTDTVFRAAVMDPQGSPVTQMELEFEQCRFLPTSGAAGQASVVALGRMVNVYADAPAWR